MATFTEKQVVRLRADFGHLPAGTEGTVYSDHPLLGVVAVEFPRPSKLTREVLFLKPERLEVV